jgi:hypothetical protein
VYLTNTHILYAGRVGASAMADLTNPIFTGEANAGSL